jgi:hypothetical protein
VRLDNLPADPQSEASAAPHVRLSLPKAREHPAVTVLAEPVSGISDAEVNPIPPGEGADRDASSTVLVATV